MHNKLLRKEVRIPNKIYKPYNYGNYIKLLDQLIELALDMEIQLRKKLKSFGKSMFPMCMLLE